MNEGRLSEAGLDFLKDNAVDLLLLGDSERIVRGIRDGQLDPSNGIRPAFDQIWERHVGEYYPLMDHADDECRLGTDRRPVSKAILHEEQQRARIAFALLDSFHRQLIVRLEFDSASYAEVGYEFNMTAAEVDRERMAALRQMRSSLSSLTPRKPR